MPIACWILSLTTIINSWYNLIALRVFVYRLAFLQNGKPVMLKSFIAYVQKCKARLEEILNACA